MKLTDLKVSKAKPRSKSYKLSDGKGLYLFIMCSGGKSWRYDYKIKVDTDKYKNGTFIYGSYPDLDLTEVRIMHLQTKKIVSQGIDPNTHKKQQERFKFQNKMMNFYDIANLWLKKKKQEVKCKTYSDIEKRLSGDVFPELGHIPIDKLNSLDILETLQKIEDRGAYEMANRARQYCSQILRYGVAIGKVERDFTIDISNALAVRKTKHQPALEPKEIPEFLEALKRNDARLFLQTRLALEMLMLTFVRPIELASARWEEIDFEANLWRIPSYKMKMKLDHVVPLASQTLKLLYMMKDITGDGDYVFIKKSKKHEHMNRDTLSKAIRLLGFQDRHTAHGFRAMARTTIRENLHWDSEIIERQLAHSPNTSLGRAYDRTQFLDQRIKMMQDWGDYLDNIKT